MAYIGKAPNTAIVNQTTSQSFNGTGSATAFTLNRSVNVSEDLEVFVNNVQQEPGSGKSYTASGTTLTFDEAPPSGTGNIYVIYRGEATINPRLEHDANAALAATTGTFSGAVSGTTGTFTGDLTVDTNTLRVDAANNRVGVGTASPSEPFHIVGASGAATDMQIQGGDDTNSVRLFMGGNTNPLNGRIVYSTASDFMAFSTGGDQRVRVDSDGLKFGSDTAAANALSDVEEGTFTATLNGGSNHPSSRLQTTGQYTKVGNTVTVSFEFNNVTTTGSPNYDGHISVFGMPFAASDPSGTVRQVSGSVASYSMATWDSASSGLFARLGDGATEWYFYANRSNDAWYPLQHSPGTNRYLLFNATYITG